MNKKLIMIICLVLCFFITLSAVYSTEDVNNETLSADDEQDTIKTTNDINKQSEESLKMNIENSSNELQANNEENELAVENGDVLGYDNPGTFSDLYDLIHSPEYASDYSQIFLQRDYVYNPLTDTAYKGGVYFNNNYLIINGQGHTIDGAGQARILQVGGTANGHTPVAGVIVMNINFVNAYNDYWNQSNYLDKTNRDQAKNDDFGAIEFWGTGSVENCNFTNGYAWCAAGIAIGGGNDQGVSIVNCRFINNTGYGTGGGAIRLRTDAIGISVSNCWFEMNNGSSYGGAMHSDSGRGNWQITVDNCDFVNNTAGVGAGGLFFETTGGVVRNSRFVNNTAPLGGALYWNGYEGEVSYCNFTGNDATDKGGAIYTSQRATTTITTSKFENNSANYGGAIYFDNTANSAISVCSFYNNSAVYDGGAIYCAGTFFSVVNSNFTKDSAKNNGGAIYLDVGAYVYKCQFDEEHADVDGGGIYLYSKVTEIPSLPAGIELGVFSTNFTGCTAGHDGGAGYVNSNFGVVKDTILKDCTAENDGGAGYIKGSYGKLIDSQLIGNIAKGNAGALYWEGNSGSITNTAFKRNRASSDGGAIYWKGSNGNLTDSNFTLNHADGKDGGGSLYWEGSNGRIENCDVNVSTAKMDGGVAYIEGDNVNITKSTFKYYETSSGSGGALYIYGENVNITKSTFMYGESNLGGAIYILGGNTYISESNLTYNHAKNNGGILFINGDGTKIIKSNLRFSYSYQSGGAVYINGDNTLITQSNLTQNNASTQNGGSVYIEGDNTNITYSFFQNCFAQRGGAIYVEGSDAYIFEDRFLQNGANPETATEEDNLGGCIYIAGHRTVVDKSNFSRTSAKSGGAIYITGDDANITDSRFNFTVAENDGASIYVGGDNTRITGSNFDFTNATRGGAIFISGDNTYIESDFTHNFAGSNRGTPGAGGSIYVTGNNNKVYNSNFEITMAAGGCGGAIYAGGVNTTIYNIYSNIAQAMGGGPGMGCGGAIYIAGNDSKIIKSKFERYNATLSGGALYVEGNNVNISQSSFEYGEANMGGGIYIKGHDTHMEWSNLTHNHANSFGGVIFIEGDNSVITDSRLEYSYANLSGGAVLIYGDNNLITKSNLTHNNATQLYGGSIYIYGAKNNITYSKFEFCTSASGGAIYINGTQAHVLHSNFTQNGINPEFGIYTGTAGGAIYIAGSDALVSHDKFLMSQASEGGFIYIEGDDAEVSHSTFTQSIAYTEGGAIDIHGDNALITDSSFMMNNATQGGAISVEGNNVNITNSNFTITSAINPRGVRTYGGAIYVGGNDVDVINSKFNITRAFEGDGGAIYVEGNRTDIRDSNFTVAVAIKGSGGVLYVSGDDVTIDNCRAEKTQATGGGPGMGNGGTAYISGENAVIKNSDFQQYNATLNGGSVFITGDNTKIIESSFRYGEALYGGSIYINGTNVTLHKSNLTNNHARLDGGVIYVNGNDANITESRLEYSYTGRSGGTVYINGNNTKIIKSNLTHNNATADGGSIYINGRNTNISDSHFEFSTSKNGGAIYIGGVNTTVKGSTFAHHTATEYGGAIYIAGENTKVKSSNFSYCNAKNGGAIYIKGDGALIEESNFDHYNATVDGGAAYIQGDDVNITYSTFEYGEATHGGAIYIKGERTYVDHSNFTRNHAVEDGGIIYVMGGNTKINNSKLEYSYSNQSGGAIYIKGIDTKIIKSNFTNNNATQKMGGSIYIEGVRTNITDSKFTNCASREGGALYVRGDNATVHNSNFTRNLAQSQDNNTGGGSIYIYGENAVISYSNFTQSKAKDGGFIYIRGSEVNITHSNFERSQATSRGGAVYVAGINATIDSSNFNKHNATYGGAVFISGENTNIIDSNFYESHASSEAGGVYLGPRTYVYNSTFINNTAYWGGAMYNAGGTAIVELSNFTQNQAVTNNSGGDNRGGAIYWEGGSDQDAIIHCYFSENKAWNSYNPTGFAYGGAIYWSIGKVATKSAKIIDSVFYKNYASRHGGAIDWFRSDDGLIKNCTFIENEARCDGGALYTGDDGSDGKNLTVLNCTFIRNTAQKGGAISQQFYASHIINITFDSNNAIQGGTIYMNNQKSNHTEYVNCTFINSTTHSGPLGNGNGGAAYINVRYISFINCTFTNGTVLTNQKGGAIYFMQGADHGLVENCNFTNTNGASSGGAIHIDANNVTVKNSTFKLNVARYGGAIYINAKNVMINNDTFESNWVRYDYMDQLGGAIYINDKDDSNNIFGNNTIVNSTFRNNTARYGGAIYIEGSDNNITNSLIIANLATRGAGIYLENVENINIVKTNITNNNATTGSGIYAENSNYTLKHVRLLDNQAYANSFTNATIKMDANGSYYVTAIFRGNDNLLNAIWNDGDTNSLNFTNVTYWDTDGIRTTDTVPQLSNAEAGMNITVTRIKTRAPGEVVVTDEDGAFKYYFEDDGDAEFKFRFIHYEDNYYTEIDGETSILASRVIIEIADIDFGENATVNVTLKDRDGNNLSGTVRVIINNTHNFTMTITNGFGSVNNVSGLPAGLYNATVIYEGNESYLGSKNSTTFTVRSAVNVTINKTVDLSNVSVGKLINFTIEIHNSGESTANNVWITDALPTGLVYIKSGSNVTDQGRNDNGVVRWNISTLGPHQTVRVWVQVNTTVNGTFGNVAVVSSTEGGTNSSNVTNVTVTPVVNLTIIKKADISKVQVGDLVNFTITVTNHGPSNATEVKVSDVLNAAFEWVNSTDEVKPDANRKLVWTIAHIANGTNASVWVLVRVITNGTFTNVATVNCTENKTDVTSNDTNVTVDPKVNLTVIKNVTVSNASVGDLVNFTIIVTNHGPSNATGVNVTDFLPIGMIPVKYGSNVNNGVTISNTTLTNKTIVVLWHIDKIINSSSINLWVLVNLTTNGTFANVAFANSNENKTNSTNSTNITVNPKVNLTLVKTTNLTGNASVGDLVKFNITVTNNGPSNATNVTIFDSLNPAFEIISAPGYKTISGNNVTWGIPHIENGKSASVYVIVKLLTNGTFTNVAFASSAENKTNSTNSTNITVEPVVDLVITKNVTKTEVLVGDTVVYTITVKNNGPSNATGVYVIDKLDERLELTHVYVPQGDYNNITGRWTIGNITKGASVILNLTVKILTNGTIPNFANVTGNENDTNITNNNVTSDNLTANPKVNLTVVKTLVTQGTIYVGDLVNYTITVTNHGPSNATNVQIVDNLNRALKFVSANGTYTNSSQRVNWTIPAIANGTSVTVGIQVRVLTNGTIENIAVVNSTENKTTTGNGTNITVEPQVNLTVVKTIQNNTAHVGEVVNFTIIVTNDGLSNATGVNITDFLPAGMRYIASGINMSNVRVENTTLSNGTTKVTWYIPLLNNGSSVKIWIQVNLTTNGTFTNVAVANSNENNTNTTNGTNITVKPAVDLVINKTVTKTEVLVGDTVVYTITVKNNGPSNATGVYVIDKLDERLELTGVYVSQGDYNNITGRWTIGNITNGASVILNLTVKILTNGTISNFANVTGNENDTNITNNNVTSDNITADPKVNLTVVKTLVTQGTIYVGDLVNYTITVTNHGPSNATNVKIVDNLNRALKFVLANGTYTNDTQRVNWTIPAIANGTSVTVWIQVRVLTNGTIENIAAVNSTENKTTTDNGTNITVNPQVNLTVVKTADNLTANVGDLVNFTITVTNNGLSNATGVNVTDFLPVGMTYVSSKTNAEGVTVSNITLSNGTTKVVWHIPLINNSTSITIWIQVNLTVNGTFTNVAIANANENTTNSSNSTNITVKPVVDLVITKTVNRTEVEVGDIVEYTITVKNNGPSNATGVYVIDKLDKRLKIVNANPSKGNYDNRTGRWTIGNITKGGNVTLKLLVKILTNGTIPNFANVTGNENDTNITNNNVTSDNITAGPKVNLTVIKTLITTGDIYVGDLVNYTITVTNNGPSNATNVQIVDELISELRFVLANGTYTPNGQRVTWIIPAIANGTSATVWIQVRALTNGTLKNIAVVNCSENKTDVPSNITNVTVKPQVNLTIIKTVENPTAHVGDVVNFTIIVTNNGLSNATNVTVVDMLPIGMTYEKAGSNITDCQVYNRILQNQTRMVTWVISKIMNGTSVKLWVLVNLTTNGTFTNVAVVNSTENNTNVSNGTNITVKPTVNLIINKTVDKTEAYVGDIVKYTIEISNKGPSNATGIKVTDCLDEKLKFINFNATSGSYDNATHIWTIDNITSGSNATLEIFARIITNGTIPNIAIVNCTENSTNKNASSENITALPQVNLTVIKTANVTGTIYVGDIVNYTITVTNNGLSNATKVTVVDDLIAAFKFDNSNMTPVQNGQKLTWTIDKIENGTSTSFWITVKVLTSGTHGNFVVVNSTENTTDVPSNVTNITAEPRVNLTIIKTSDKVNASVGELVNFTIIVTNYGPSNATGVNVTDMLPAGMTYYDSGSNITGVKGHVDPANASRVIWNIDHIVNGTSVELWLTVNLTTNGTFRNVAVVASNENRTNTTNGTNITVKPVVDLVITKNVTKTEVHVGDIVEYTITVKNNGPSNATGVYVIDELDSRLEFVNSAPSQGSYNNITYRWTIGNITSGRSVTLSIRARVIMNGTIPNFANVTGNENDTNITNNNDTSDNVTALPQVNLTVIKTVTPKNATVGDVVNYTITVINNGLSNATNVNISDVLNPAFEWVNSTDNIRPDVNRKLVWTIKHIENGTNASVWVQVRLLTNGTFTNVAVANCLENTTDVPSNETNITVAPDVKLTIVKTADLTTASVCDLVNFTITVTNNGLSNATNVVISDTLDKAFEIVKSYENKGMDTNRKITWTIDKLENGTSASVWIQVRLLANGTFTNVAHANSTENTTDVPSNETNVTVKPKSNITIIKYADIAEGHNVSVGDTVKFIIIVKNHGPNNATNVMVSDNLNEAFGFKSSNNTNYELDGRKVTWTIDKLDVNETVTIELYVNATKNGFYSNLAIVNATESENVTSNETVVTILPAVNLTAVKKANLTGNASVGDLVNFTITIYNKGPSDATNVNITDILPSGMMYVKSSDGGVNATVNGVTTVTWNIGKVNLRQTVEVWVVVKVLTNGTLTNIIKANSTENETGITNRTDINVTPVVDLVINKTVKNTTAYVGDIVEYTITVKNNGPSNATGVYVFDELDSKLKYDNFTASQGKYNETTHKWTIGNITAGNTVTLTIKAKVIMNGTIPNFANVTGDQNDTNKSNNNDTSDNITALPQVNLTVIKTPQTNNVSVGDLVNFTIVVTNNGLSNATKVKVADELIAGFGFVNATGNYTRNGQKVVWTIDNIENGTSKTLILTVKVLTNGTLTNVVHVNCSENKTDVPSNTTNVTVKPKVNLTVVKTANVTGTVNVGDSVTFTINVTNNGPSNATNVTIVDDLNSAFEIVSAPGNTSVSGNKVTWSIPHLANGTSHAVTVTVKLLTNGTFENVASVSSNENTTNSTNGTNITVKPVVDLVINKTVNKTTAYVGDIVVYTITVTNKGPSNATGVYVFDELDSKLKYDNSTATQGEYDKVTHKWVIGNITAGNTVTLTIKAKVIMNGTIPNFANVTGDQNDTNITNNNDTSDNVTALAQVNLTVIKTPQVTGNVSVGDVVNYTITVTNNGLSNATNVKITDDLINGFKFDNASDNPSVDGQKVTWTIDKIENGTSVTVWITVKVMTNGTLSNFVVVNCSENITDVPSNTTNITVKPKVNLTVVKTANVTGTVNVGDSVTFTINVTNNGPSNATDVTIVDDLNSAFEIVSAPGNKTVEGNKVIWIIPHLANGTSKTVTVTVKLLTNGTFENVASVSSIENKTNSTNSTNVTVKPVVDLMINKTVDKTNVTIGDTIIYIITVKNNGPSNATNVEVTENLKGTVEITVNPSKGTYSNFKWTIPLLEANETAILTLNVKVLKEETIENSVVVKADQNDTNTTNNNYTSDNVTVNKIDTPIKLETKNITYGDEEPIKVTLPVNATGTVNITVGNVTYPDQPISNGVVELTIPNLAGGEYNVTVTYPGDDTYKANSTKGTFKVSPRVPEIKIEVVDIWYGEVEVLNVTVNAPGFVNITVGNGVGSIIAGLNHTVQEKDLLMASSFTPYGGKATWKLIRLAVGQYPVHATYLGNENYTSVSTDAVFNVRALPSVVNVTADDIYVGEDAIIKVSLTPNATGNVTVTIDGKDYPVKITNGTGHLTVPGLKAGLKNVTVKYDGDEHYLPSENSTTFNVKKIKPPIDVDSQDIYVGEDETITVTLPSDATGKVTITVDGKKYTADVVDGVAEFNVPGLKAGKYTVTASYSGDDKYLPIDGADKFKVSKQKPDITVDAPDITVGDDGTITVELHDDATGKVTIEVEGKRYTAEVKNGKAVFKVPGLSVGVHGIKVWYSGDDKYLPTTTEGDITVHPVNKSEPYHEPKGLEKHATGNPIIALIIVLVAIVGVNIRKFRK